MAQAAPLIGKALLTAAASTAAGVAASKLTKTKMPELENINDKRETVNEDAALRNAQDLARKRKGIAANMLSGNAGSTAGSVGVKKALGQ